jgi:putative ATP-binding cassette transporter
LHALLHARLPDTAIISVGHRSSLAAFHQHRLEIRRGENGAEVTPVPVTMAVG